MVAILKERGLETIALREYAQSYLDRVFMGKIMKCTEK